MGFTGDAVRRNFYDQHDMRSRGRQPNQSVNKYADLYRMYHDILTDLATNRFKWTGFPPSIDVRFLELTLHRSGLAVFYFDERYGQFFALRGTPAGVWNVYDNPTKFQVTGNSFINRVIDASYGVPIWAKYSRRSDTDIVNIYAAKFADLDLSLEINAHNARRGKMVASTENQKLSARVINDMIDRGDPTIFFNRKAFDPADGSISTLDLGIDPDQLLKFHMFKSRLWSECMGLLGIDNANQDKKERLVAAEVSANDGQTDNMRRVNLNAREQAAERINKKWPGLHVEVSFHVDDSPEEEPRSMGELNSTTERAITRG